MGWVGGSLTARVWTLWKAILQGDASVTNAAAAQRMGTSRRGPRVIGHVATVASARRGLRRALVPWRPSARVATPWSGLDVRLARRVFFEFLTLLPVWF